MSRRCLTVCCSQLWVFLCFLLPSSEIAFGAGPSPLVATYRSTVTETELDSWLAHNSADDRADRQLAVREIVLVNTLADEAVRLGLDNSPRYAIEIARRQAGLIEKALRHDVAASIHFSDAEVEAKYQSIKDTYTQPRRVRLRNIFKRYSPQATRENRAAVRAEMKDIRRRLLAGADFLELARSESDSQTRFQKGLIGNVAAGKMSPEIDAVAMAMAPGEISAILETENGLTILYCESILPAVIRTEGELRDIAGKLLRNREFKRRWNELEQRLVETAGIRIWWQLLENATRDDTTVVVEYSCGTLTTRELEALTTRRGVTPDLTKLSRGQIESQVKNFLQIRMMRREASTRGLLADGNLHRRLEWTRLQELSQRALLRLVEQDFSPPTQVELEEYFDSHQQDFVRPRHFDLAVIVLTLDETDVRATYGLAEQIVDDLARAASTFADAARRYSDHPSAGEDGSLGWVSERALPSLGFNLARLVPGMEPGERSDLVQEGDALWIVELRGVQEARPRTYEEARTTVDTLLGRRRAQSIESRVVSRWLDKVDIVTVSEFTSNDP